jgi:hypothetical protein
MITSASARFMLSLPTHRPTEQRLRLDHYFESRLNRQLTRLLQREGGTHRYRPIVPGVRVTRPNRVRQPQRTEIAKESPPQIADHEPHLAHPGHLSQRLDRLLGFQVVKKRAADGDVEGAVGEGQPEGVAANDLDPHRAIWLHDSPPGDLGGLRASIYGDAPEVDGPAPTPEVYTNQDVAAARRHVEDPQSVDGFADQAAQLVSHKPGHAKTSVHPGEVGQALGHESRVGAAPIEALRGQASSHG